jgi:hypothetical protein
MSTWQHRPHNWVEKVSVNVEGRQIPHVVGTNVEHYMDVATVVMSTIYSLQMFSTHQQTESTI